MNHPILLIDNFDSFTYNLVHLLEEIHGERPRTMRVDAIKDSDILESAAVVISPGPGLPEEMRELMHWVDLAIKNKPTLGVCLGHQAITMALGGTLSQLNEVYHGVARKGIITSKMPMYDGVSDEFDAGSYHSWTANTDTFPDDLHITAQDSQGEILSFIHANKPVWGVQFHPESILTPDGKQIVQNWFRHWQKQGC
jgi:anthranilate synthase component 2